MQRLWWIFVGGEKSIDTPNCQESSNSHQRRSAQNAGGMAHRLNIHPPPPGKSTKVPKFDPNNTYRCSDKGAYL